LGASRRTKGHIAVFPASLVRPLCAPLSVGTATLPISPSTPTAAPHRSTRPCAPVAHAYLHPSIVVHRTLSCGELGGGSGRGRFSIPDAE
jgi:hypothetical protein